MSVVLGLVFVVLGVCLKWAIFPALVTSLINTNLKLKPNTEAWDAWVTFKYFPTSLCTLCSVDYSTSYAFYEVHIL